jgi:hypothetical protein
MNRQIIYRGYVISILADQDQIKVFSTLGEDVFPMTDIFSVQEAQAAIDPIADNVGKVMDMVFSLLPIQKRNNVVPIK